MADVQRWRAELSAPFSVCLWLADSCNLACKYCYASPFSGQLMDARRLPSLIGELIDIGVFDIALAGGEPFLHPDTLEIIRQCIEGRVQVAALSNGTLLDERLAEKLAKIVEGQRFILQVSVDSADAEINNKTRGNGARVLRNLERLAELGIQIQIACVLTASNITCAHLLIERFYPRIRRFHFLNVQRTAATLAHPELLLDQTTVREFWIRLRDYAKSYPSDLFLPSLRIMLRAYGLSSPAEDGAINNASASFHCRSCSAGITHINITADYDVLGCDIAKDFTKMGNVRENSFQEVWNSEAAHDVRNAGFPACYRIRGPDGGSLQDHLRPEFSAMRIA